MKHGRHQASLKYLWIIPLEKGIPEGKLKSVMGIFVEWRKERNETI